MVGRTAIVGAGIAGIAAAHVLLRHGRSVTIFDKGRRPGGRVSTRRMVPWQWDHGAQFFTVRDAGFAAAVATLQQQGLVQRWLGPFGTLQGGSVGPDPRPGVERWVGVPGMSALANGLAQGLRVECGHRIVRLGCDGDGWWLEGGAVDGTGGGTRQGPFAELVLAVPPFQAWELVLEGAPRHPGLALLESSKLRLQPCLAAMAVFAEPLSLPAAGLFVEDEALGFVAHDGSKPGRNGDPSYVLHANADWSAAHQELQPEQFAAELLGALRRLLGRALPAANMLAGHRWRYALMQGEATPGQWSANAAANARAAAHWPPLVFAGDWMVGGRVEGAFVSGCQAAELLLRQHPAG